MKIITTTIFICFYTVISIGQDFKKMNFEALDSLFGLYVSQGKFEEAMLCGENLVEKAKLSGVDSNYTYAANNLAMFYQNIGKYDKAIPLLVQAIEIHKKNPSLPVLDYATTAYNLGKLYRTIGLYENAKPLLLQAIEMQKKALGDNNATYAQSLNELGNVYKFIGEDELALDLYLKSKNIRKNVLGTNHNDYAASLNNLAMLYRDIAQYETAEGLMLEAIKIRKKVLGENHPSYAVAISNLAVLYMAMGNPEAAEPFFLQALEIRKNTIGVNHPEYAAVLNNLASLYKETGKFDTAKSFYLRTLEIRKQAFGENNYEYAQTLANLANIHADLSEFAPAESLYLKAIEILKKTLGENHNDYTQSLYNLGHFYMDFDKLEKAEKLFLTVADIRLKVLGKNHPYYILALNSLGNVYFYLGNNSLSRAYYNKAILSNCKDTTLTENAFSKDFSQLLDKDFYTDISLIMTLQYIHGLEKAIYDSTKAKDHLEYGYNAMQTAMKFNEKRRNSLTEEDAKLRLLQQMAVLSKITTKTGIILSDGKNKKYIEDAWGYAEQNKSILLTDAIKGQKAYSLGDLPDSLIAYEMELQDMLKKLEKASLEATNNETRTAIQSKQNELKIEIETFLKNIKGKYPKYHALKYANIAAKSSDIQALLDDKTLFLEYFKVDSVVYLFTLTKNSLDLFPIPLSSSRFLGNIERLRQSLTNYKQIAENPTKAYEEYTIPAYWFYKQLVYPALKNIPKEKTITNLIIVADGELGHIPFEAFLVEEAEQKASPYNDLHYLVKDYNISYNYSATLWKENLQSPTQKNNGEIIAFAPDYNLKSDSLRAPHLQVLRKSLITLPAALSEIESLSEYFKGSFQKGLEASETNFRNQAMDYGVIHLAMHGLLNKNAPILSSLAFAEDNDSIQDNFLEAYEISRLRLHANLVVLSACETGYGKFQQGEGVLSLARSFMYAGVPSLIVSLWQVNDHSTSFIMKSFYQHLAAGNPKDAALRQAKLEYLKLAQGIAAHPAFWSAFIQLGDSRAIEIKTKTNWWYWGIGILAVSALGALGFVWKRKKE